MPNDVSNEMTDSTTSHRTENPIELEALRILCAVCHVGSENDVDDTRTLWGEGRLQELDHLLRHADSLALVIIDHLRQQDGERPHGDETPLNQPALAAQVRQLLRRQLSQPSRGTLPSPVVAPRRLEATTWRSLDDALAFLVCRDLLRLSSRPGDPNIATSVERGFTATSMGTRAMAELSSRDGMGRDLRDRCRLLVTILEGRALDLDGASRRLADFLHDEQIAAEDDPTPRLFYSLFGEPL